MRLLLSFVVGLVLLWAATVISFRMQGMMLVYPHATVFVDSSDCTLHLRDFQSGYDGLCSIDGQVTGTLDGDTEVRTKTGTTHLIYQKNIRGYLLGESYWHPFDEWFAMFAGFVTLLSALALDLWIFVLLNGNPLSFLMQKSRT